MLDEFSSQRRRALVVLLASVGALVLPQGGSAQGLNIGTEIARIRDNIVTELSSPLARLGLLDFAGWFRSGRIATSPLGYEAGGQFTQGSQQLMMTLGSILPSLDLQTIQRSEPDKQFIDAVTNAQNKNASTSRGVFDAHT